MRSQGQGDDFYVLMLSTQQPMCRWVSVFEKIKIVSGYGGGVSANAKLYKV